MTAFFVFSNAQSRGLQSWVDKQPMQQCQLVASASSSNLLSKKVLCPPFGGFNRRFVGSYLELRFPPEVFSKTFMDPSPPQIWATCARRDPPPRAAPLEGDRTEEVPKGQGLAGSKWRVRLCIAGPGAPGCVEVWVWLTWNLGNPAV